MFMSAGRARGQMDRIRFTGPASGLPFRANKYDNSGTEASGLWWCWSK
jgi:hypothetical protein